MKALILAGGKGTRLRPITYSLAKQLVPVANKPVIEYGIDAIVAAGIKEIGIIVIEPNSPIEESCGDGSRWGAKFTYIVQPDPLGLAHAVVTAKPFLGDDDFIMYLGDNLIKSSLGDLIAEFQEYRPSATVLLTPVPDPTQFGVAEMEGDQVVRLEEKPKQPRSNLALVGVYLFDRVIHDVIAQLKPSARGEYEITEAIQGLIDRKMTVRSHIVTGWWKDTGTVEAMLDANRLILEDIEPAQHGEVSESQIEGRVIIGKGAVIKNSKVRGPAIIGEGCLVTNSYIGPFSAIDKFTSIQDSEIENSIVLQDCQIIGVTRMDGCLIGRGASVKQGMQKPACLRLVLGDSSEVTLP
jgi:glucose-1-phosphate thymidylyltransferase